MTEVELEAEGIIETVLHLKLGFLLFFGFGFGFLLAFLFVSFVFCFFPFDETPKEQLLRHHLQDWRLRDLHQNY
jgi:hypothetical protein